MARILVTRITFPDFIQELERRFEVEHNAEDRPWPKEELVRRLQGKQGVLSTVMDRFDESVIAAAPDLKAISNIAVGYNNIDVAAATKRGIRVTNTPGVLNDTTADFTWATLMAAARRVPEADAHVRAGRWKIAFGTEYFLGADVHHATLGMIGIGRIGQAIARRATGFDMRVLYHDPQRLAAEDEKRLNATWVERDRLLAESDFVVVMVPYSKETHHFIGAADFAKMKRSAIFVHTARGGVVDDAALVEALKSGRIAGAGVDVFEGEPALDSGYLGLRNVVLTPHIASASHATRLAMCRLAAENMAAALEGRRPPNLVNTELA